MFADLLLAAAFQVGPFGERRPDFAAVRPLYSREGDVTDVAWPLFTSHRDWWRFCLFVHYQSGADASYQFDILPFWFNGRSREGEPYAGLFPLYGRHPHVLALHDAHFALWPVWLRYRMPRPSEGKWMTTNAVLFPFVHWRDDGSWGFWPLCGLNRQRESDHRYALWPFVTWADYREDRDTAGAGSSWMLWPFCGRVSRARERAWHLLPPLVSVSSTRDRTRSGGDGRSRTGGFRVRAPWPFVECESSPSRERLSLWPLYERSTDIAYGTGAPSSRVTRFGWKLVELYDDETRVFPFWTRRKDGSYFRLWPFCERSGETTRVLALFPIRWAPAVDRNWAKFWTLYECSGNPVKADHSLFWGLVRWRTWR